MATDLDAILRLGGLRHCPRTFAQREAELWLVDADGQHGILRRLAIADAAQRAAIAGDRRWQHDYLADLASTGFPAPAPLARLDGASVFDDMSAAVWELLTFVEGNEVGWAEAPAMRDIGSMLGAFHDATSSLPPRRQRPTALPLAEVPDRLNSSLPAITDAELAGRIAAAAHALEQHLVTEAHTQRPQIVIHGDFTNHNVIAGGDPRRPVGVIDFGLAHVESPLVDIGFGLWRSGRAHQDASSVDPARAADLVRGYAEHRELVPADADAIVTYIAGRGLQMLAKRLSRGQVDVAPLKRVERVLADRSALVERLSPAIDDEVGHDP